MNFIQQIQLQIEDCFAIKDYQKAKDELRKIEAGMLIKYPVPVVGPYDPHPFYTTHLEQCRSNFLSYVKSDMKSDKDKTWGVGDSILAQSKKYIGDTINKKTNDALGGMWAHHMLQMINDMNPIFIQYGFVPKNIVIGTLGGNPLLNRQEINSVIEQSLVVLNRLRELYPLSRIIIYGIPMTISAYLIQNFQSFDTAIIDWMMKDINSVFIPMIKDFVEKMNILPKGNMSCDGVHLTGKGVILFEKLIQKGKSGAPKRLINNG